MSMSPSATRSRAPRTAGSEIAPANQIEVEGFGPATPTAAPPAPPRRKPRRVTALPPLISNLGEPVGIESTGTEVPPDVVVWRARRDSNP